jgi:hypothetical protein
MDLFDAYGHQIRPVFHAENDDKGTFHYGEEQDCEDIIESNKYLYNLHDQRAPFVQRKADGTKEVFHRVGNIPMVILMDLMSKGILDDDKAFKKWLDDPDNKYFRTRPGRLS